MDQSPNFRLSRISTMWSRVLDAHDPAGEDLQTARQALASEYGPAVQRYLLGALSDEDGATELYHEFTIRFLQGDFHRAAPEKGKFRKYLKTVLINLVNDYHRSRKQDPMQFRATLPEPAAGPESLNDAHTLESCLQEELMARAWTALEAKNSTYHAVLLMRVETPDMSAREIGELLDRSVGGPMATATVRKTLERARTRFSDLLLDEVLTVVESDSVEAIQAELDELGLLPYCRSALDRRF